MQLSIQTTMGCNNNMLNIPNMFVNISKSEIYMGFF